MVSYYVGYIVSGAYLFIEANSFTSDFRNYFYDDEIYGEFQSELAAQPEKGQVIAGATPLRKIRWADKRRGMGKRGGLRVIYLHIPDLNILYLLDVYGKDEAEDLSKAEKVELQSMSRDLIRELRDRKEKGRL